MRGFPNAQDIQANTGDCEVLSPNLNTAENSNHRLGLTSTGFYADQYGANRSFVYMAIRRPDGYVGKPPELGTDVFSLVAGVPAANGNPTYITNGVRDFVIARQPATTENWNNFTRLTQGTNIFLNTSAAEYALSVHQADFNNGMVDATAGDVSQYQGWLWKRGAGFDVVTYAGNSTNREIRHSMGIAPTMVWLKSRTSSEGWVVGTSGLSSWAEYLTLNNSDAESTNAGIFNSAAPTATHFSLGSQNRSNENNQKYIAFLFASVEGISKVGSYSGNGSTQTITTGFSPRFLIIKRINGAGDWFVLDTLRGWGAGDDKKIQLNESGPQSDNDMGAPTATGFSLSVAGNWNGSGATYLYYAHA